MNDGYKNDLVELEDKLKVSMNLSSGSTICNMIKSNKVLLTQANLSQSRYIESWNINVKECSQVMYLDLSKFDEMSNDDWN